jgi:hypothetical protein
MKFIVHEPSINIGINTIEDNFLIIIAIIKTLPSLSTFVVKNSYSPLAFGAWLKNKDLCVLCAFVAIFLDLGFRIWDLAKQKTTIFTCPTCEILGIRSLVLGFRKKTKNFVSLVCFVV